MRASGTAIVTRRLGRIRIEAAGNDAVLFFDNAAWGGNCHANIRILGDDTVLFFNDIGDGYVALPDVFMRSSGQFLFWGRMATAVGCNMEVEGDNRGVVIGDDALISGGVWIRNCDMHSVHDLRTGARINRLPVDTVIERHVWLGQDAMLLSCERIGMGSILGARALLKRSLPACVAAAGPPARPRDPRGRQLGPALHDDERRRTPLRRPARTTRGVSEQMTGESRNIMLQRYHTSCHATIAYER